MASQSVDRDNKKHKSKVIETVPFAAILVLFILMSNLLVICIVATRPNQTLLEFSCERMECEQVKYTQNRGNVGKPA